MSKTILCIDDSGTVRTLLLVTLSRVGYRVLFAENGEAGLDALQKHPVDLVILDLFMPGMNGLEVAKSIRANEKLKDLPVFVLTTELSKHVQDEARDHGVSAWLTKPFAPEKLLEAVARILAKSSPRAS